MLLHTLQNNEPSTGITLLVVFVILGVGKVLAAIAIWRVLKAKDKTDQQKKP